MKLMAPGEAEKGKTMFQTAPTEAIEKREKAIINKLSEMALDTMRVGMLDDTIFRFGFWGQGAMMKRAELIEEEAVDQEAQEEDERGAPDGVTFGRGEEQGTWGGKEFGKKRSKQMPLLHLVNKTAFEKAQEQKLEPSLLTSNRTMLADEDLPDGEIDPAPLALPAP